MINRVFKFRSLRKPSVFTEGFRNSVQIVVKLLLKCLINLCKLSAIFLQNTATIPLYYNLFTK
jgi:hypothetical protein